MERFYTKILGTPVVDDDMSRPITTVKDVIVDPESGSMLAVVVNPNRKLIISANDILFWGDNMQIHTHDAIIKSDEVLRVEEVLKRKIKIYNSPVETQEGEKIGKVFDFSVDTKLMKLKKIFVGKSIFGLLRMNTRLIDARDIVEIKANKIIVKEGMEKVKKESTVVEEAIAG